MSAHLTALLATATSNGDGGGGGGGGLLGLALLILLLVALSSGRKQIRWEYTGRDGRQHFTEWYDADEYYLWEHPDDPTHFDVRRRGES